jgi:hypothetical protein
VIGLFSVLDCEGNGYIVRVKFSARLKCRLCIYNLY